MKVFERYPHINDIFEHYCENEGRPEIISMLERGPKSEDEATVVAKFAWSIAEYINRDEELGVEVLGSVDNTEMIPDLSYEISLLLKNKGFYYIWKKVSEEEMS